MRIWRRSRGLSGDIDGWMEEEEEEEEEEKQKEEERIGAAAT